MKTQEKLAKYTHQQSQWNYLHESSRWIQLPFGMMMVKWTFADTFSILWEQLKYPSGNYGAKRKFQLEIVLVR
jgi:hypothetical protein